MYTSNIGLIGLAVMGENLALNFESKGFTVSVFNRLHPGKEMWSIVFFVAVVQVNILSLLTRFRS